MAEYEPNVGLKLAVEDVARGIAERERGESMHAYRLIRRYSPRTAALPWREAAKFTDGLRKAGLTE